MHDLRRADHLGPITIELVLALTLLGGSVEAVTYPSRMAAVNMLVPRRDLSSAIALGSTTFNGARIVGPALAGGLILWIGIGGVIAIGAATFLWFAFVLLTLRIEEPGARDGPASTCSATSCRACAMSRAIPASGS